MPSRILVLEPDPMEQVAFRAALASAGHPARTAASVAEAAERLRQEAFDLVLLGPGMGAAAAADLLREAGSAPPLVRLAVLPDCVVGEAAGKGAGPPAPDLPGILEALTRYRRFAPPPLSGHRADMEDLLQGWAEFDRQSGG